MDLITQENLANFCPSYPAYEQRLTDHIPRIGVESTLPQRQYREALETWNRESAIGFNQAEMDILSLIYPSEEANIRFSGTKFLASSHGGNTAEHPIFMGHAFDHFKDQAGYTPNKFDPNSSEWLELSKLSQQVHGLIAVHDIGELVDISYSEAAQLNATIPKEPEQEKLIAPFKFQLAAYALSTHNPILYTDTIAAMRGAVQKQKAILFEQAIQGIITGDDFIRGVGTAIETEINKASQLIQPSAITADYALAISSLNKLDEQCRNPSDNFAALLMNLTDKYEGSAHFNALMNTYKPQNPLYNQLYNQGQSISYLLASSNEVISNLRFALKEIGPAFAALEQEPKDDGYAIKERLTRAASAVILRNYIIMLQKAPPLINFGANGRNEPTVSNATEADIQEKNLRQRFEVQQELIPQLPKGADRYPITRLEGVMDTKTIIALCANAANLIETGQWTPSGKNPLLFEIGADLPKALCIPNLSTLHKLTAPYPLEAKLMRGQL